MADYKYAEGDLMGHPQTYFYTRFEGEGFLQGWRRSRQTALDALPTPAHKAPPFNSRTSGTARLLELAFKEANSATTAKGSLPFHAEAILRKYEVGKRIYDQYDEDLKPVDKDRFRTHIYYVRAAESFETAYARTRDLRALNALLKSLDTLTAHAAELEPALGARVARLILEEWRHVARIASDRRVEIK
jgi:hypothetical protein